MLYKADGNIKIHGKMLDTKIVDANSEDMKEALKNGWKKTTAECKGKDNK